MLDLALLGGSLVDGTGAPARTADVGLASGRIASIGSITASEARATVDCRGLVVAPGFIDVHNHSDGWLLKQPYFAPKLSQGFTTEVLQSDGIGYAPLTPELAGHWIVYLRALNGLTLADYAGWSSLDDFQKHLEGRTAANVALQLPLANLRVLACGWQRGAVDDSQQAQIDALCAAGMAAGAVSLSSGLDYVAQFFATTDELVAACRPLAGSERPYVTHVRYRLGTQGGLEEAVAIARRARVPLHVSHLKAGTAAERDGLLDYINRMAIHEVDFTFDVYPYASGSTLVASLLPYDAWEAGPLGVTARLGERSLRERFTRLLLAPSAHADRVRLAWVATQNNAELVGLSLIELAKRRQQPIGDAVADLLIEEQLAVLAVFEQADESLVEPFLTHPRAMIASDGIFAPGGLPHPRVYGTAPRLLGHYVRERKLMSLETAVRKLTSQPAQRFGLAGRGRLIEGSWADVVVLNPETIADRATYAEPYHLSTGVERVWINGQPVWPPSERPKQIPAKLPGQIVRWKQ